MAFNNISPVLCVLGPTCSGKTVVGIQVAHECNAEIVSVDSIMVYRGLDIGSAKPSAEEQQGIPHHLIDIAEPTNNYSAALFVKDCHAAIDDIQKRHKLPILVGGTAMYYHVLQNGIHNMPATNESIRSDIVQELNEAGWDAVYSKLEMVDMVTAKQLKTNDQQRLVRALEVYTVSGKPLSEWQAMGKGARSDLSFHNIIILPDRSNLRSQINTRFDDMIVNGFIDEVQTLRSNNDLGLDKSAIRSVGYRQAWQYLDGAYDYDTFLEKSKIATAQLAKRQFTWFKKWASGRDNIFCDDVVSARSKALQITKNVL